MFFKPQKNLSAITDQQLQERVDQLDAKLKKTGRIVDALKLRDQEAASAAMKVHLDRVFDTIRTLIVQKRDYFATSAIEELKKNYIEAT